MFVDQKDMDRGLHAPRSYSVGVGPKCRLHEHCVAVPATSFQQVAPGSVGGMQTYLWSNPANWTNGLPHSWSVVDINIADSTNPGSYDDICHLRLDALNLQQGFLAVGHKLTVGDLVLTGATGAQGIEADSLLSGGRAVLIIKDITGSGAVIGADGVHALTKITAATDTGNQYKVADDGTLVLSATPNAASALEFPGFSTDHGTIALRDPGVTIAAHLSGISAGDVLELPGCSVTSVTYGASTLVVVTNIGTVTFTSVAYDPGQVLQGFTAALDRATGLQAITFACFVTGTRISTPSGEIAVEDLRVGDLVVTAESGPRPVVWLGRRAVDCEKHRQPDAIWPIRVAAHAFGANQPGRDLYLSPEHAVFAGGVLIPVSELVNGTTITQAPRDRVTYWHIELERHDIILAEGLPVESFLENDNRYDFEGEGALMLHPMFGGSEGSEPCAPIVRQGVVLQSVRNQIDRRAAGRAA